VKLLEIIFRITIETVTDFEQKIFYAKILRFNKNFDFDFKLYTTINNS